VIKGDMLQYTARLKLCSKVTMSSARFGQRGILRTNRKSKIAE